MRALLFRLRWRLAHLICPELGVEARLKTARVERARVGFFDLKAAKASLVAKDTIKRTRLALNLAEVAVPSEAFARQGQSCAPKSWECLQTQEQAEVYLAGASEAELREMAERLLAGRRLSHAEAVPQRLIALALCASGALSRRVTQAVDQGSLRQFRWHPEEIGQGGRK